MNIFLTQLLMYRSERTALPRVAYSIGVMVLATAVWAAPFSVNARATAISGEESVVAGLPAPLDAYRTLRQLS